MTVERVLETLELFAGICQPSLTLPVSVSLAIKKAAKILAAEK